MFKINPNTNLMLPQENHQEKQDVGMWPSHTAGKKASLILLTMQEPKIFPIAKTLIYLAKNRAP